MFPIATAPLYKKEQNKNLQEEKEPAEDPTKIARYYTQKSTLAAIVREIATAIAKMKRRHPHFAFKSGLELFTTLRTRGLERRESDTNPKNLRKFHQEMGQRICEQ